MKRQINKLLSPLMLPMLLILSSCAREPGGAVSGDASEPRYLLALGICSVAAMLIGLFAIFVYMTEYSINLLSNSIAVHFCIYVLTFGGAAGALGCFTSFFFGRASLFFGISLTLLFIASVLFYVFTRKNNEDSGNIFLITAAALSLVGALVCFTLFFASARLLIIAVPLFALGIVCEILGESKNANKDLQWLNILLAGVFCGAAISLTLVFFSVNTGLSISIALITVAPFLATVLWCIERHRTLEVIAYTIHIVSVVAPITVIILCTSGIFLKLALIGVLLLAVGVTYVLLYFPSFGLGYEIHQAIGVPVATIGSFGVSFGFIALGTGDAILSFAIASAITTLFSLIPLVWTLLYRKKRFASNQTSDEASASMLITGTVGASLFAVLTAVFFAIRFILI
ncbi:MAG: hypothetical protein IKD45_01630 [Clostridia bacterium]|nr:hypothetical protein [Clostridia bacterium]